jgi:hypothetical protein
VRYRICQQTDGQTDGRTDGQTDGRTDGQTDGQTVSQNVLKIYQQLIGVQRRILFIFDDFRFCRSRVIGLDKMENSMFTICRIVT